MSSVTICIPTYNHAAFLEQAVVSAATQTYPDVKVIIADDASTDATPEIAARLAARFPNVQYHRHPQNIGRTANADWVMRQGQTEFIVRLDSDDLLAPRYVEETAARLLTHPQAGYGHTAVREIDGTGAFRQARQLLRTAEYEDAETALRRSASGYRVAANILIFRRAALQAVGYLDLRVADGEDYDLSIRLADAGFGNVYCPDFLASYRVFGGTQWSYKRVFDGARGHRRIYVETLPQMYRRRDWDETALARSRRARARLACSLFSYEEGQSEEARRRVTELVFSIDHSRRTRLAVAISRSWFAPLLGRTTWYGWKIKGAIKGVIVWLRSALVRRKRD